MTITDLRARVLATGSAAGLDQIGVASSEPFPETLAAMMSQVESGRSGGLGFTFKDPETATDVARTFPWAKSLIVGIRSYLPQAGSAPIQAGHGRIARFAVDDPYTPLRRALEAVAAVLRDEGHRAEVLIDDDRLVDRAAAVRAGLGWWGKSTIVITPGLGPWFVIGTVVTGADIEVDAPMVRGCGTCEACLPACPTGALVSPGVLDTRRCLAAIAQTGGVIPREWRASLRDRLYGCDDCLDACPPGLRLLGTAESGRGSVSLEWILSAADNTLLDAFSHFYLPRRSARILRRNALVAIGNDGGSDFVAQVGIHLGHPDWLLRAHAVWAFGRVGGEDVAAVLSHQLRRERRAEVRSEIHAELAIRGRSGAGGEAAIGQVDVVGDHSMRREPHQR